MGETLRKQQQKNDFRFSPEQIVLPGHGLGTNNINSRFTEMSVRWLGSTPLSVTLESDFFTQFLFLSV